MRGKRGLIMGVANERSIAWGIARAMADQGAELAFCYQGEAFGKRVEPLAASVGSDFLVDADVTNDASLDACFAALKQRWGTMQKVLSSQSRLEKIVADILLDNAAKEYAPRVVGRCLMHVRDCCVCGRQSLSHSPLN